MRRTPRAREIAKAFRLAEEGGLSFLDPDVRLELEELGLSRWFQRGVGLDTQIPLFSALKALEIHQKETRETATRDVTLVLTSPTRLGGFEQTEPVVKNLLQTAKREVLIIGYQLKDSDFRDQLIRVGQKRVRVTVLGSRADSQLDRFVREWPTDRTLLAVYRDVEPAGGQSDRIMHGKVVVQDCEVALVGSANFSFSGLRRNFEFGLRVRGPVAKDLTRSVEKLLSVGLIEEVKLPEDAPQEPSESLPAGADSLLELGLRPIEIPIWLEMKRRGWPEPEIGLNAMLFYWPAQKVGFRLLGEDPIGIPPDVHAELLAEDAMRDAPDSCLDSIAHFFEHPGALPE